MKFGKQGQFRIQLDGYRFFGLFYAVGAWNLALGRLRLRFPAPRNLEWDDLLRALSMADFHPQSRRDYALISWWLARWFFAWFVTLFRTPLINLNVWLKCHCWPVFVVTRYVLPLHCERRHYTNPIICSCCYRQELYSLKSEVEAILLLSPPPLTDPVCALYRCP